MDKGTRIRQSNPISKRKRAALDITKIREDIEVGCICKENCTRELDELTVLKWRKKVHSLPMGPQQQEAILNLYRETVCSETHGKTTHLAEGHLICRGGWCNVLLKISRSTFQRVRRCVKNGVHFVETIGRNKTRAERGHIAQGFMHYYTTAIGDRSPETDKIVLPPGIAQKDIFEEYSKKVPRDEHVTFKHFSALWSKEMKDVTLHKSVCNLSKCTTCLTASHALKQNLHPSLHETVIKERQEHLQRQQNERAAYYERRADAVANPGKKLSIIIDGMDQSKTNLPHFKGWRTPKRNDPTKQLHTHITGAIAHGRRTHMMIDFNQYPHDSNLAMNCLLKVLTAEQEKSTLGSTLYIQMDNCARENKNKYFLGFVGLLVHEGYFKEVMLSYLMVGHTHEDIDARFGRISNCLKKKDAKSYPALEKMIQESLESQVHVSKIGVVFNIREWIQPYLQDIHNHTGPHVYRVFMDNPDHVAIQYKNWSTDPFWLPNPEDDRLELFKIDGEGKQIMPVGNPGVVEPDFEKKVLLSDIQKNIEDLKFMMKYEDYVWWGTYLSDPVTFMETNDVWYLTNLNKALEQEPMLAMPEEDILSPLRELMEKERAVPDVYVGKRKRKPCPASTEVSGILSRIEPGYMIGYKDEDGDINFGQVEEVETSTITVVRYRGSLNSQWQSVIDQHESTVKALIDVQSVVTDLIFLLGPGGKLPNDIKRKIKEQRQ